MDKYKNKYRIPSTRLQNWDYGSAAMYFITICTQHRIHYFGDIVNQQMQLSEIGKIAETEWLKTFELRSDMNLFKGEFVVMPDHFHAIIGIGENSYNTHRDTPFIDTANHFGPQSKNLASIVRGFKSSVTIAAHRDAMHCVSMGFQWQARFYDHIIRNEDSFHKISNYIITNPANWRENKSFNV